MKGLYWIWVSALVMGLGIVAFTNYASREKAPVQPVFETEETQTVQTDPLLS